MKICKYVKKLLCIGLIALLFCSQLFTVKVNAGRTIVDDTTEEIAIYNKEASCSVSSDKDYQILESNGFRYKILENETVAISGYYEGGTDIIIPERIEGKLVTRVDDKAFQGLEFVDTIVLPESLISIGNYAFFECRGLKSFTIPGGVESIGESAFRGCDSLKDIMLPPSVKEFGSYAFGETRWLEDARTLSPLVIVNNRLVDGQVCTGNVKIPEGVLEICGGAFFGSELSEIHFPEGVETIGEESFARCGNLVEAEFPESLTEIGDGAFQGCGSLSNVKLQGNVIKIGDGAFSFNPNLSSIELPESIREIGNDAFVNCNGLKTVTIPKNVVKIGIGAFGFCTGLLNISVDINNESYSSQEGMLYDKVMTRLIQCPAGTHGIVKIPEGVKEIEDYAFLGCSNIGKSVYLPNSVTEIGNHAFEFCGGLEYVKIPQSVTEIGDYAFHNCDGLVYMEIPEGVTKIGEDAFLDCSKELVIKTDKGSYAETYALNHKLNYRYMDDIEFEYKVLKDGTLEITRYFGYDDNVIIPVEIDGKFVTKIGEYAFHGYCVECSIVLPERITEIGRYAFEGIGLNHINFPEGLRKIGEYAFFQCPLTNIELPQSLIELGNCAFQWCNKLESVRIPGNITEIGYDAFFECRKLTLVVNRGSSVEAYAKKNELKYRYMDGTEPCSHTWRTSITKAVSAKNGSVIQTCTKCGEKNTTTIYAPKTITLSQTNFIYNNRNQKPSVTIKDSKGTLLSGKKDYSISYPKSMKNVGQYTVIINFKGKYTGTVKRNFTIVPQVSSILKVTPRKKGFTIKWRKQAVQVTGYEIAYSTDSRFTKKNTKIISVKEKNAVSKSISKLKPKKNYYVRIRTYKTVKGKKYHSEWSKEKKVTTKK